MEDVPRFYNLNKACPKDGYPFPCIDQDEGGRPRENILHHKPRFILLQSDAIWSEKCRSYLPEASQPYVSSIDWAKH